jgi:putative NIF3 family GTP cyclohydrolase 1 type 2
MSDHRYTCQDVAQALESMAPLVSGIPGDELGFVFGEPHRPVQAVGCLWSVDTRSILRCVEQKLNLLICHEGLWLPEQVSPWYAVREPGTIASNRRRRELLEKHELVVYRSHSNWDALPRDGVPDQALAALGIAGLREVARQSFFSVQQLPSPLRVRDLAKHTQRGFDFPGCRVFGDRDKRVRRFAVLIGGFGENQWHMPQAAVELGAEALIIGEMSEFIVIASLEMGIPVIESLHSASEIPAIRRQATLLAEKLPGLPVRYVASGATAFDDEPSAADLR